MRVARQPITIISVMGAASLAKSLPGCFPARMPASHSLCTPSVRGYFRGIGVAASSVVPHARSANGAVLSLVGTAYSGCIDREFWATRCRVTPMDAVMQAWSPFGHLAYIREHPSQRAPSTRYAEVHRSMKSRLQSTVGAFTWLKELASAEG